MVERYVIQRFLGFTDAKPSWTKIYGEDGRSRWPDRQSALDAMTRYAEKNPTIKYRVRKVQTRR